MPSVVTPTQDIILCAYIPSKSNENDAEKQRPSIATLFVATTPTYIFGTNDLRVAIGQRWKTDAMAALVANVGPVATVAQVATAVLSVITAGTAII
jgi:hypothetical protein